jgi:cardiolipin synthase (CMP-forming)
VKSVPNLLTLLRIGLIPVVVTSFYIDTPLWRWIAVIAFSSACLTDFLDGYLARLLSQTTPLGQFLDPVADKLLVATTLLYLAGFDKISRGSILAAAVILCREILISGLREHLSALKINLPVSRLAKWKTFVQMGAIGLLLVSDASYMGFWREMGECLLWISALLTIITAVDYGRRTMKHF